MRRLFLVCIGHHLGAVAGAFAPFSWVSAPPFFLICEILSAYGYSSKKTAKSMTIASHGHLLSTRKCDGEVGVIFHTCDDIDIVGSTSGRDKTRRLRSYSSVRLSTLEGAACMNNTLCLGIFYFLIWPDRTTQWICFVRRPQLGLVVAKLDLKFFRNN